MRDDRKSFDLQGKSNFADLRMCERYMRFVDIISL